MACKTYIFINSDFLQKLKTKLKNLYHTSHTIPLSKGTLFDKKNADILQKKMLTTALKGIFPETICVRTYVPNFKSIP